MEQRWGLPLIAWPSRLRPNLWDLVALPLVLGALALIAWGGMKMGARYEVGESLPMSLDPWRLPEYALRTVLRMAASLVVSLAFSFPYAALAAKSRQAEKILIPVLDILQSVPVLGFLSITVTGFIAVSRAAPWRRMRRDLCDLYLASLEHDVQPLPVVPHGAGRAGRGGANVSPVSLAAVLAARSTARRTAADLEHDDVGVGRVVLCRRVRSHYGLGPDEPLARRRLLYCDSDRRARSRGDRLRPADHAYRDPFVRSAA